MTEDFTWDGEPLSVKDAFDHLNKFAAAYGHAAILLALHLAVLERFRGDLVALVRRKFLPKALSSDVPADADVLFGPLSWNLGGGYYRMDAEVRRQCLVALDVWGSMEGDTIYRSRRVAQFVRQYVSWSRRHPPAVADPVFADYLNTIEWVALGFDDPEAAAVSMAQHMRSRLGSQPSGASAIRLTGLAAVLELPMAAFMDELNYARAIDALDEDDYERAVALVAAHRKRHLRVGNELLPPPQEMLDRYRLNRYLRRAGAGTPEATPGEGTRADGAPSPHAPNLQAPSLNREPAFDAKQPGQDFPLHVAARAGQVKTVEALLAASPESVDVEGVDGKTALHLASERGDAPLAELLLSAGANPNLRDARGRTPLYLAAVNGREAVAALLIVCAGLDSRNLEGTTPLAAAVANGHDAVARLLIEGGASANSPNNSGHTPLAFAVSAGRLLMVELLLSAGVDPRRDGGDRVDLMYLAARSGRLAIVEMLVDKGLRIDRRNEHGWTPFMLAAFLGHAAVADFLIEVGAYPNATDASGWTALHLASYAGHAEVIRRLIRRGAAVDLELPNYDSTPLHLAAYYGHTQAAAALLEGGADPCRRSSGQTPLLLACERGPEDLFRLLLAHPATDPFATNPRGYTALQLAVEFKNEKAVRGLLADPRTDCNITSGELTEPPLWRAAILQHWKEFHLLCADPRTEIDWKNAKGETQLHLSAQKGEADAVNALIAAGAQVDLAANDSETPLHKAVALSKNEDVVRSLLAHGADPARPVGRPSQTPLMTAVAAGFAAAIRLLVLAGARLEGTTSTGMPLLHQAAGLTQTEVVDTLIALGCRVEERDFEEAAPLHSAAATSGGEMIRHLLSLGAKVDRRDRFGLTPLHYALRSGNLETAKELIEGGADVTAANLDGWTVMHFAAQRHLHEAVDLLIAAGAAVDGLSLNPPMTPLQVAAESGAADVVERLLAAGADPEASNQAVGSPLVLAIRDGHYAAAKALLAAGAGRRGVDPSTGVGVIDLFHARLEQRKLAGEWAEEGESEVDRLLTETERTGRSGAAPAGEGPVEENVEPSSVASDANEPGLEPSDRKELALPHWHLIPERPGSLIKLRQSAAQLGTRGAPDFAPLSGLEFADPEGPASPPWHVIHGPERLSLLEQLRQHAQSDLSVESTQVVWAALSFYEQMFLLRVRDRNWTHPRRCLFYLWDDNSLFRLDGTSPPIHEVNAKAPIRLDISNVIDYARFFGFFVRGEEGPFHVLESPDDLALGQMPGDTWKEVIKSTVRPARLESISERGHFLVEAIIAYSNALFLANFDLHANGMIEMTADEPLVGDLPAPIIDAPLS